MTNALLRPLSAVWQTKQVKVPLSTRKSSDHRVVAFAGGAMIDRVSARALVDAGYMPLSEYLQAFPEANFSCLRRF
jgi:hypothetical protein